MQRRSYFVMVPPQPGDSASVAGATAASCTLNGSNFSSFDGYWTATSKFYLPPKATNIVLTYTNLGLDDAGVLFLNTNAIGATFAGVSATGANQGNIVLVDGGASQTWDLPPALMTWSRGLPRTASSEA